MHRISTLWAAFTTMENTLTEETAEQIETELSTIDTHLQEIALREDRLRHRLQGLSLGTADPRSICVTST